MSERNERFDSALATNQIVSRVFRLLCRTKADLNRLLQPQILDALDNDFKFLAVAMSRIQNANPINGNHFDFIVHAASSKLTRSAMPRK